MVGIGLEEQPPSYYRLLGIVLYEPDPDVIANAADQRMVHLKRFNTGEYGPLAEQLLNEVAAARVCLLNPAKKANYDQEYRQRLGRRASVPSIPVAVEMREAASPGADMSFLTQLDSLGGRPRQTGSSAREGEEE